MAMHKIKRGDTFWGLAREYNTTIEDLRKLNPEVNEYSIPVGTNVRVRKTVADGGLTHILKAGETLSHLAKRYKVPLKEIFKLNPGVEAKASKLPIGTKVVVRPAAQAQYKVKRGDTMYHIADNHGMDLEELIALNPQVKDPNVISVGEKLWVRPDVVVEEKQTGTVDYILKNFKGSRITSDYGSRIHPISKVRRFHYGIDFSDRKCGTGFKTPVDGKIVTARWLNGYGNTVVVECNRGYWHIFAHASLIRSRQGQAVKRGDVIFNVGATGAATGCHVHYQINPKGVLSGPSALMNPKEY